MSLELDATERRIVGSLVEKQLSVPESYPLTLLALVAACNQRSNRDPETSFESYQVEGAVRALMERGWVRELELAGGRTRRYAHDADGQLGVDEQDLAILAELLLRGPQSAVELKTRASRMRPFASPEDVEARLRALASRPTPYARLLGKRPGERVARWEDLLGARADRAEGAPGAPPGAPVASAPPSAGPRDPVTRVILERLDRLERAVDALREEAARRPPDDLTV
jgi:uncharacterized protein YceH (UPF0502 family)